MTLSNTFGPPQDKPGSPAKHADATRSESGRSIKVLHVINDLSIGGAEMMLYRLLSQGNGGQFESTVLSLMDRGPLREQIRELGVPVDSPGMSPAIPAPNSVWKFVQMVRRIKPDLIHGWLYHANLASQLASVCSFPTVPVIWSIHGSMNSVEFEKRFTSAVVRLGAPFSRRATAIVFVSSVSLAQHRALGYSVRNSFVIPNGIDIDLFTPSKESRASVRRELQLPENALLIGLINRYHPMKDQANFIRAAATLRQSHPEVHYLLAGREVDRSNANLCGLIGDLGLANQTHLLGERTDTPRLTSALDILSLSSLYGEGFPIIVGEAMACEVPCVVTDVGDSGWLVGDTGRKVRPGQPAELTEAWRDLIEMGAEARSNLGRAARLRVVHNFSLPSIVEQYHALYLNSLQGAANTIADERIESSTKTESLLQ